MKRQNQFLSIAVTFLFAFVARVSFASVVSDCQLDTDRHCPNTPKNNHELSFCLKKRADLLTQSCHNAVWAYLQEYKKSLPTPTPIPATNPNETGNPSVNQIPLLAPEPLVRYYRNEERYQACLKKWNQLGSGYFVLTKEESCNKYAKVYPTTAIQSCADEVMGKNPGSRDYYLNFESVAQFCEANPVLDNESKKCFKKKVKPSGDIYPALNRCNPDISACIARMENYKPITLNGKLDQLYYEYCVSYGKLSKQGTQYQTMGQCITDFALKYPTLFKKQDMLQNLCHPNAQTCLTMVRQKFPDKPKLEDHEQAGELCFYAFKTELENEWARCTYSKMKQQKFGRSLAGEICKANSEKGRQCLIDKVQEKKPIDVAKRICQIQSESTKECLKGFGTNTSPFNEPPLKSERYDVAEKYCLLSTNSDRQCFLEELKSSPNPSESKLNEMTIKCREKGESYKKCMADFTEYFLDHGYSIPKSYGIKTCQIPMVEVRECILSAMMRTEEYYRPASLFFTESREFPYEKYFQMCLGRFLSGLLGDLKVDYNWACRYQKFNEMNLYNKSYYCAYNSEKICKDFKQSLPSTSTEELRPNCKKFYRKLEIDEQVLNKLWQVCEQRNLLPKFPK